MYVFFLFLLGIATELWSRHRFLNCKQDYFYCELTGSLALDDIFDSAKYGEQPSAAVNYLNMPTVSTYSVQYVYF